MIVKLQCSPSAISAFNRFNVPLVLVFHVCSILAALAEDYVCSISAPQCSQVRVVVVQRSWNRIFQAHKSIIALRLIPRQTRREMLHAKMPIVRKSTPTYLQ
jgi:hypothetical protein